MNKIKEWLNHWVCVLRHRPHHFTVHGTILCRICDAHLLDVIIGLANNKGDNALTEFAKCADNGLAGRQE